MLTRRPAPFHPAAGPSANTVARPLPEARASALEQLPAMCLDYDVGPTHRPSIAEWCRRHFGRIRRVTRSIPLIVAVTSAVIIGAGLIWLGFIVFEHAVGTDNTKPANRADVLKTALTAVAGVGGAVALVVAYRRQQDLEEGRFVERFGAAAAQLGNSDPAVRIAGVYAMAGVADERKTTFLRRQQCIDVLCGYLRLPYDASQGASHITELVTTTRPGEGAAYEEARHQLIRQNDREVRQTIVRVIVAHLQNSADVSWSAHDFDFVGVLFENANFGQSIFRGTVTDFQRATFSGPAIFNQAVFSGDYTWFKNATFIGDNNFVTFDGAQFNGKDTSFAYVEFNAPGVSFDDVTFSGDKSAITFKAAKFNTDISSFEGARFTGNKTTFEKAAFVTKVTSFRAAEFSGTMTEFDNATFYGRQTVSKPTLLDATSTSFEKAVFGGQTTSFVGTAFNGSATNFIGSEFRAAATKFDRVQFKASNTNFSKSNFSGDVTTFVWARFDSAILTSFDGAHFQGRATSFEQTMFREAISFNMVKFSGEAVKFHETKFMKGPILFIEAVFDAAHTEFIRTEFLDTTMFDKAKFEGVATTATFDQVVFGGEGEGRTTFHGAKFGNKATLFSRPRAWKVSVDWDHFPEEMPGCIVPRTWPPPLLDEG
ncbi:pentapeptide repeat-containing protein [Mycobacterium sp. E2989]|uniref:pentapeptide repeat-containing protein n=1 Tax=Mycobacterium sp. E2989 TaxID=1834140 RepID=UPI0009EF203F|nr:pentapeptide repeat-containing protein [Mycobacterium sp. E2989]